MQITITRFVSFESDGSLKAFCDVAIGDYLLIKGIRVVEGKKGPFVSMPRQQSKNGKWYDSVVPLRREIKTELVRVVLEAFHAPGSAPPISNRYSGRRAQKPGTLDAFGLGAPKEGLT